MPRTVIMITFECMSRSEVFLAPPKYHLRRYRAKSHGTVFRTGTAKGIEEMPTNMASANNGRGIS